MATKKITKKTVKPKAELYNVTWTQRIDGSLHNFDITVTKMEETFYYGGEPFTIPINATVKKI